MEIHEGQGIFFCRIAAVFFVVGLVTLPVGLIVWLILALVIKESKRA